MWKSETVQHLAEAKENMQNMQRRLNNWRGAYIFRKFKEIYARICKSNVKMLAHLNQNIKLQKIKSVDDQVWI